MIAEYMTSRKLLTEEEITSLHSARPDWRREGLEIVREFKFADFAAAMRFVNGVAELAEAMDHHPDIDIRWNKVRLALATHSAGGLTAFDFQLAEQIDRLHGGI